MKRFYRIFLLIIVFIFLSTYSQNKFEVDLENNSTFFKIEKIIILNNLLINKEDILTKLNQVYGKNIFLIKRKDIEESLENISFLEKIEVKKKYPDTVIVKIFETIPVAILFKDKIKYLLDSSSNLVLFANNMDFDKLPMIFGEGAENNFTYFFDQLKNNNFPKGFQILCWNCNFAKGVLGKCSHKGIKAITNQIYLFNRV